MENEALFSKISSFDAIRATHETIKQAVNRLSEPALSDIKSADKMYEQYLANVPIILDDEIYQKKPIETTKDISRRRDYLFSYDSNSVPATRFTFIVPFKGDDNCFDFQPSTYTMGAPTGIIENHTIKFVYDVISNENAQSALNAFNNNLDRIKKHLETLRKDFESYNNSLKSTIETEIKSRLDKINKDLSTANSFGIPIK